MSWFSQAWRKAGPTVAAAAAVASGNPQLAPAAYQAASATIKPKKQATPIEPPAPAVQPGFLSQLVPADRNALVIGGTFLGTLVLGKILFSSGGRR